MNYYKKKYAIGIYKKVSIDTNDELVALFFSIDEFAIYLNATLDNAYNIAKYHFQLNPTESDIVVNNKLMTISFIDMTMED